MTDRKNMSIMELAHQVLFDNGKAMTFVELFDIISKEKEISEEEKAVMISQVYADFITSGKFIYVGDDEWDIKGRQTIDLWDKDGAYYDEYPDYEEELSLYDDKDDEYSIEEDVEEEDEEDESVYEDDFDEDDIEDEEESEYDAFVEDDDDYIEDEEDLKFKEDLKDDEDYDDFEEEEEEEEEQEEFDDEEYNEYMDDYEQMYDD